MHIHKYIYCLMCDVCVCDGKSTCKLSLSVRCETLENKLWYLLAHIPPLTVTSPLPLYQINKPSKKELHQNTKTLFHSFCLLPQLLAKMLQFLSTPVTQLRQKCQPLGHGDLAMVAGNSHGHQLKACFSQVTTSTSKHSCGDCKSLNSTPPNKDKKNNKSTLKTYTLFLYKCFCFKLPWYTSFPYLALLWYALAMANLGFSKALPPSPDVARNGSAAARQHPWLPSTAPPSPSGRRSRRRRHRAATAPGWPGRPAQRPECHGSRRALRPRGGPRIGHIPWWFFNGNRKLGTQLPWEFTW